MAAGERRKGEVQELSLVVLTGGGGRGGDKTIIADTEMRISWSNVSEHTVPEISC